MMSMEKSPEEGDCNMLIMPGKRKVKRKNMDQTETEKCQKLSESQKRKLKKLQEEEEKGLLLQKTMENLEKYKLPDDAYKFLQSSQNIGQVETVREKRRRAVQYSKEGIELPSNEKSFSGKRGYSILHESESEPNKSPTLDFYQKSVVPTILVEREGLGNKSPSSFDTAQDAVSESKQIVTTGCVTSLMSTRKIACDSGISKSKETRLSSPPLHKDATDKSSTKFMGDSKQRSDIDSIKIHDVPDCPPGKSFEAPVVVYVLRPKEVENNRKDLPIIGMEQEIMEAINHHSTVIICGQTGCGKTTQVPQFLYEAGFGSSRCSIRSGIIGVTQPRRVAVLATARRVAFELGFQLGKEVGFQVRHDKRVGESSSIKFMTDGILLREFQDDVLLRRYSVIVIDEAHERSLNTDILIGLLSRIIKLRQVQYEKQQQDIISGIIIEPTDLIYPLKLVLMSATLRVEDFCSGKLFHDPPQLIEVPTRQFSVTVHFSKRTEIVDYIGQAYKKVLSIHKRLPNGGILVFVTGKKEVDDLCRILHKASKNLVSGDSKGHSGDGVAAVSDKNPIGDVNMEDINEAFDIDVSSTNQQSDRFSSIDEDHCADEYESDVSYDSDTESELEFIGDDGDSVDQVDKSLENVLAEDSDLASLKTAFEVLSGKIAPCSDPGGKHARSAAQEECPDQSNPSVRKKRGEANGSSAGSLRILPLYAMLPAAQQLRVFEEVKEGERLVVVATNVAETSLTIPGIKYVVDTGREKVKKYDPSNGMETYEVQWISKASASQRAGRAGRTAPGHCYRLYSSAVFTNQFCDFSPAEILKIPVDGLVLLLKSMHIGKVANFPFPTPPETSALIEAERCLKALEALDNNGKLTPLGNAMARYPMSPRHSRMLLTAIQMVKTVKIHARACLVIGYAAAAAAALSLSNPFLMQFEGSPSKEDALEQGESEKVIDRQEKLRKKKLKEILRLSRAKFSNPSSDALTIANALHCFELSGSPVEFCNENALHLKTMEEMSKLRKQLLHLIFHQTGVCGSQKEFLWEEGTMEDAERTWRVYSNKNPLLPSEDEELLLCQAICAGWVDRVAKRIKGTSLSSEVDRETNAVRYQACMVKETVFLHRRSSVSRSAPEYLVYNELVCGNRPYMHGVTRVKDEWLVKYGGSFCTFSSPVTDPCSCYEPKSGEVFCYVDPTFGPHLWQLKRHRLPISNEMHRVTVFAYILLKGQVLQCLKYVEDFRAADPASILRPEALGQKRVGNLLYRMRRRLIDSRAMLREVWRENPRELYSEIMDWFQKSFHNQFEDLWLEMQKEAAK